MTWHFERGDHALDHVGSLHLEAQLAFFNYIPTLEADPDAATDPHGEDVPGPVRMREKIIEGYRFVFLVSDNTRLITLVDVQ